MTDDERDEVMTVTIYNMPRQLWEQLRQLGFADRASASAQLVELAIDHAAASPRKQRDIIARAAVRSKGRSSRAKPDEGD